MARRLNFTEGTILQPRIGSHEWKEVHIDWNTPGERAQGSIAYVLVPLSYTKPQGSIDLTLAELDLPDVFNDLDIDFSADPNSEAVRKFRNDSRNQRKIREAVSALAGNVNLMNPLREGKKLLVLDLDYSGFKPLSFTAVVSSSPH